MSNVNMDNLRSPFFPNKSPVDKSSRSKIYDKIKPRRNDDDRADELKKLSQKHTKVNINSKTKDFSLIKSAVDKSPDIERSEYLQELKSKIKSGSYQINPEKIAEKMILNEF